MLDSLKERKKVKTTPVSGVKTIEVPGIGEVMCRKNRHARRIIVHVSAFKGVWVTLPCHRAFGDVEPVVKHNKAWIDQTLLKLKSQYAEAQPLREKLAQMGPVKAKEVLSSRLSFLARQHGFCVRRVSVRNQRTRWGSCNSKKCISLNVNLILLPEDVRDYVLLHELVHTKVHNHSRAFYDELDKVIVNRQELAKKLREMSLHVL